MIGTATRKFLVFATVSTLFVVGVIMLVGSAVSAGSAVA